jgi:DNA polymerase-3 subunit delta'
VSRGGSEEDSAVRHPRASSALVGHEAAEHLLLDAYRSGRMPHAWLIGGPAGIGKATLAYRAARFVLAHPEPRLSAVQAAQSLFVDPSHPVFHRVAAEAHSDLLALFRTAGDSGKLRTVITVEQVRRTVSFFGSTAGEGGWRVCIVDAADHLSAEAANALLKVIEEPPARSLFFLISAAPGRLFATIRSRCRRLNLRPLDASQVAEVVGEAAGRAADDADLRAAVESAGGSPGRALALLEGKTLALRGRVLGLLAQLPGLDPTGMHALGEEMAGTDPAPLVMFMDTVADWLSARLKEPMSELGRLARVAEVWEKVHRAARDVETYNLERKPLVFSVFGWLAEATR